MQGARGRILYVPWNGWDIRLTGVCSVPPTTAHQPRASACFWWRVVMGNRLFGQLRHITRHQHPDKKGGVLRPNVLTGQFRARASLTVTSHSRKPRCAELPRASTNLSWTMLIRLSYRSPTTTGQNQSIHHKSHCEPLRPIPKAAALPSHSRFSRRGGYLPAKNGHQLTASPPQC